MGHPVRTPLQVARRAIALGAISFRASLEVTTHPRVVEISRQLLPWLHRLGIDGELDPIERNLLVTPLGKLGESLTFDANWAGESAMFFCWCLKLAEPLESGTPADASRLPEVLSILRPEASAILDAANLRDAAELESVCKQFVLTRSALHEARIGQPASQIIRRLNQETLAKSGLIASSDERALASETVAAMSPEARDRAAGLYLIREQAALWLFSDRPTYFEPRDEERDFK